MFQHLKKWFIEHSLWDITKEILRWVFGPATLAWLWGLFLAFRTLSPEVLACIQLAFLAALGLALIFQKRAIRPRLDSRPQSQSTPFTLLDFYGVRDNSATYKLKLRAVFRNDFPTSIKITRLQWHASNEEIQIQPDFAYRFQAERTLGGWRSNAWNDESLQMEVLPGWAFRFWVGISPNYLDDDIRQRHETRRVGTATLSVTAGAEDYRIQIRL